MAGCARDWVSILKVGEVRGLQRSGVLGCVLGEPCGGGEQAAAAQRSSPRQRWRQVDQVLVGRRPIRPWWREESRMTPVFLAWAAGE